MRTIEPTSAFRRDFRRESKGPHRAVLDSDLKQIITDLALGKPLAARHRDHALTGQWKNYRDCHVRPDLVLIYRLIDDDAAAEAGAAAVTLPGRLVLLRLGSHSELSL